MSNAWRGFYLAVYGGILATWANLLVRDLLAEDLTMALWTAPMMITWFAYIILDNIKQLSKEPE